jgi:hypothetical protein
VGIRLVSERLGLLLLVVCFFLGACATTGSGVNRGLLFGERQKTELPYKVTVVRNSMHSAVGTSVDDGLSSSSLFLVGGLGGIVGGKAVQATGIQSAMRGKFLADEAFEDAVRKIAFVGEESSPIVSLELTRFEPLLKADTKSRKLIVLVEFTSEFVKTEKRAKSTYVFEYTIGSMDLFGSSKEKDVLREMTESAITHWAREFSNSRILDGTAAFPMPFEGTVSLQNLECRYSIFQPEKRMEPIEKRAARESPE